MLVVVGLGGNALLRRGDPLELDVQRSNLQTAISKGLASVARKHQIVITHGNGPQIGLLALQAAAYGHAQPYPLDVLGAESVGMIGYLIAQILTNKVPDREVTAVLTQVEVDSSDPAFAAPTKPIGPIYREAEMRELAARYSWSFVSEPSGFRRAVPSPMPGRIVELNSIRSLVRSGVVVICAGGGGIPVVRDTQGLRGVEAVIDKDHSSALLAEQLEADALLLLTDVEAVWSRWPMARGEPIGHVTPEGLGGYVFDRGSMGPKVEAACRFVNRTGHIAGIGAIEDADAILEGHAGTIIEAQDRQLTADA